MMTPPIGVPDLNMSAAAAPFLTTQPVDVPNIPIQRRGGLGGMFGGGNAQMALMAAISGLMARRHPEVSQMMQGLMSQRLNAQDREVQRQQQLADEKAMYDYKLAHPEPRPESAPGSMDALRAEYLDPNTTAQRKAQLEPIIMQPQLQYIPGMGLVSVPRTGTAAPQPPSAPVGKLTILGAGGQTPPASGGFPY